MEEANISNNEMVKMEDLFMLIGQKDVALLNKNRQIQILMANVGKIAPVEQKVVGLTKSSNILSQRNIELDRALTETKKEVIETTKKLEEKDSIILKFQES